MGKVKIKISHHPRGVYRTTTSHLVPKVKQYLERKKLGPLKISSGSGIVEYVPLSKGENANILDPWRKCQYLGPMAMNKKTKDSLFSLTLKVEEKKVSFLFSFMAQDPRYVHFNFEVR